MIADDLTPAIWNAIADQVRRMSAPREVVFAEVTKVDTVKLHIWADDFGDVAIPLVALATTFAYYDTLADGSIAWRGDKTQQNSAYQTQIVMPKVGEIAVILDLAGARSFPLCIGILQSQPGFWESA